MHEMQLQAYTRYKYRHGRSICVELLLFWCNALQVVIGHQVEIHPISSLPDFDPLSSSLRSII
jgi:hypothetical protein